MKTLKTFFLCLTDCFDVFRIRRIESSLLDRSLLSDLKYLVHDILLIPKRFRVCKARQNSFHGSHSTVMYASSGSGRCRYQVMPHIPSEAGSENE